MKTIKINNKYFISCDDISYTLRIIKDEKIRPSIPNSEILGYYTSLECALKRGFELSVINKKKVIDIMKLDSYLKNEIKTFISSLKEIEEV